jgi:hypothetical protein
MAIISMAYAKQCGQIRLTEIKIMDKTISALAHRSNDTVFYARKLNGSLLEQLRPFHIESMSSEITEQKYPILALLIIKYGIAIYDGKNWYHANPYCIFINTQTEKIVTRFLLAVSASAYVDQKPPCH